MLLLLSLRALKASARHFRLPPTATIERKVHAVHMTLMLFDAPAVIARAAIRCAKHYATFCHRFSSTPIDTISTRLYTLAP